VKHKLAIVAVAVWVLVIVIMQTYSGKFDSVNQYIFDLMTPFLNLGLFGIFLSSALGTAVLFIQIPYYLLVYQFLNANQEFDFMIAAVFAVGFGATIGETIKYYTARKVGNTLPHINQSSIVKKLQKMVKNNEKLIPFLIFVVAFTPPPDDVIVLPLGLIRYRISSFVSAMLAGKIVLGFIFVFGFDVLRNSLFSGVSLIDISAIITVTFVIFLAFAFIQGYTIHKNSKAT